MRLKCLIHRNPHHQNLKSRHDVGLISKAFARVSHVGTLWQRNNTGAILRVHYSRVSEPDMRALISWMTHKFNSVDIWCRMDINPVQGRLLSLLPKKWMMCACYVAAVH